MGGKKIMYMYPVTIFILILVVALLAVKVYILQKDIEDIRINYYEYLDKVISNNKEYLNDKIDAVDECVTKLEKDIEQVQAYADRIDDDLNELDTDFREFKDDCLKPDGPDRERSRELIVNLNGDIAACKDYALKISVPSGCGYFIQQPTWVTYVDEYENRFDLELMTLEEVEKAVNGGFHFDGRSWIIDDTLQIFKISNGLYLRMEALSEYAKPGNLLEIWQLLDISLG